MPELKVAVNRCKIPVDLYYKVHGSGPIKIVLVNGMGSIASSWDPQVSYFAKYSEYSVLVFDNRGVGFSSAPDVYYSTKEMALDVVELLDYLQWKHIHIYGLSMGGMIAQELAFMLKDNVKSLTLASTYSKFNGLTRTAFYNFLLSPSTKTINDSVSRIVNFLFPENWLSSKPKNNSKFSTNRDYVYDFLFTRYSETGLQSPIGRFRQQVACIGHYFDNRLRDLKSWGYPILVIAGDDDLVLRQPCSSIYLAHMLDARLEIYPGGGHALRLQDPEWHNELFHEHIRNGQLK